MSKYLQYINKSDDKNDGVRKAPFCNHHTNNFFLESTGTKLLDDI